MKLERTNQPMLKQPYSCRPYDLHMVIFQTATVMTNTRSLSGPDLISQQCVVFYILTKVFRCSRENVSLFNEIYSYFLWIYKHDATKFCCDKVQTYRPPFWRKLVISWKLYYQQHSVLPVSTISSIWRHFRFSVLSIMWGWQIRNNVYHNAVDSMNDECKRH